MKGNLSQKLIEGHLLKGKLEPGEAIHLKIDQTLTQDATGTMVMISLEAMGIDRVETEVSAQYIDHNLLQTDHRNADDHLFLESASSKFGVWFSRAGNGVSHPVHMERCADRRDHRSSNPGYVLSRPPASRDLGHQHLDVTAPAFPILTASKELS